jgi:hypothetical protein
VVIKSAAPFQQDLVTRIIKDAGDRPDQLPMMQHDLMRTWKRFVGQTAANGALVLTQQDYQRVGGIEAALSKHADKAWDKIKADLLIDKSPAAYFCCSAMYLRTGRSPAGARRSKNSAEPEPSNCFTRKPRLSTADCTGIPGIISEPGNIAD